jgi:hypothetical protein
MDAFVSEAVAACPIGALWAGLAFWIIDAFLMWASKDALHSHDGQYLMLTEKVTDFLTDDEVVADVIATGEPAFEQIGFVAFIRDDRDSNLCSQIRSRPVEGDSGDRVASESAPDSLRQPGAGTLDLLHAFMKYLWLG